MPSIIVYPDVFLSNRVISSGVRGKNRRKNTRSRTQGGHESINVDWIRSLREWELGFVPMRLEAWHEIETLHEITDGGAFGFLFEDPKDHLATSATGLIGLVTPASGSPYYQLYKRSLEPRSGRYRDRPITRPRTTTFALFQNGIAMAAGSYTLDAERGRLTVAGNPDAATLSWSGKFWVPVHFKEDFIDWEMVAPGSADRRLVAGPSVVLEEVRE